jgi:hypothetical protein
MPVNAAVLTFDDFTTDLGPNLTGVELTDGYGGLDWSEMWVIDGCAYNTASGYCSGIVSGDYVAYNRFARITDTSSDSLFDFQGAYLSAAWSTGLNIRITGYSDSNLLFDTTVVVDKGAPTWFDFAYVGIDHLEFDAYGGTDATPGDSGEGEYFVMDNFTYSVVPIPAAVWLFGSGLGLLGWVRRRQTA